MLHPLSVGSLRESRRGSNILTRTITDTAAVPNVSRTWTYTYNSLGQVLTENGPRTDVSDLTTYTYYNCTTGGQCGQIQTVTNALNQVTTYNAYNAHGQPTQITDPNNVVTQLAYDLRQRLTARCVNGALPTCSGGELTAMEYYPTGLLKKVTNPDGSFVQYSYDAAHRLTQVQDAAGNKTVYTLDAMGNRTAENVSDPSNALRRTRTQVFNNLNQLWQQIAAAGTVNVTTQFGYDNNGNQTSINAPLARNTTQLYDELNRLKQITDPANGNTIFTYDANDNLTSVKDPKNLTTSYSYTGFGDVKTLVSPDTGTTTNTYDSGGNLATSTDARSAVTTHTYDALNRVTSSAFRIGTTTDQTISFTYDAGTHGKGRLTGASDANHSMAWVYDAQGRVTGKSQIQGTVTQTMGYGYSNGRMSSMTLPSGNVVSFQYNTNNQVSAVLLGGTTLVNNVTYEPFGPIKSWTWGNGTSRTLNFDLDGKVGGITSNVANAVNQTYSYDDAFRITAINDTSTAPNSWTYGYDALDRLTSATGAATQGWTYDANGNRLTETGSTASTFTNSATSNRLTSTTGFLNRTYSYDAVGNATGYEDVVLAYNHRNRLKSTTKGGVTRNYVYNALGQMIKASGGTGGTVLYAYDESGHLIGEYDATGALIQETVWLGDTPIATLRPGSPVQIYYVHADHLNTPRKVTQPSDNKRRWQWTSDAFGTTPANNNPEALGVFTYNLRFPGQVFDGHAGLHQNYFRDYSPAVGRYVESDPIGLRGGINTYAYVGARPTMLVDPQGLAAPAAAGLCFVPGIGWVGCGVAAVGIGSIACFATGACQKAIKGVGDAIKDACEDDDDDIDCEEYLKLVNQDYTNVLAKEALGVNMEAAKLEHDQMVDTFCITCPDECPRALRFGRRILH